MEEIRLIRDEEWGASSALSQFAFQYELTEREDEERRAESGVEGIWGYFADGQMAAKLRIIPLHVWVQGQAMAMGGIASVATWPEYRRQGMVGKLLTHALKVMKEEGQTVSALNPFSFAFYQKYGWEACIDRKTYELGAHQLPVLPEVLGRISRVTKDDWPVLNSVYEVYAHRHNGMLKRDEAWWRNRVLQDKHPMIAVHYDVAEQAAGYVIYQVKDRHCRIKEMAFVDEAARRSLWKFLGNHDSMLEKLTLPAPPDDRLVFLLDNKKVKQELKCTFMYRIVDVAGFLRQVRWAADCNGESRLVLRVEDRYAPWNDGLFEVAIDGAGRALVDVCADARYDGGEGVADAEGRKVGGTRGRYEVREWPMIACSIQTLTALLFGYQSAEWLREIGRLECSDAGLALLEARIPRRTAFIMDSF